MRWKACTNLALQSWQQALKLNPSPLQAVRLTLLLADKLTASGRDGTGPGPI